MAASTASREASRKNGDVIAYPVQAGVVINKGTFVFLDNTGYARPGRSGVAGDVFIGVAYEAANNTFGAAGAHFPARRQDRLVRVPERGRRPPRRTSASPSTPPTTRL